MDLIQLGANQPPARFYRGGARIDRFRGVPEGADFRPEDWVGSTTTLAGEPQLGLSTLPDGRSLAAAVAADPVAWLGAEHIAAHGVSTMLLVKLLDAGQRLPVHAHPGDAFSRAHVHRPFGKAEAWYILEGGTVHLGLRHDIDPAVLARLVATQDAAALVGLLHAREVAAGDVVYVPPGELHAIGEGIFLVEVQQPEDQSILLEWTGFELDGARDGHLGLGFDVALEAVTKTARTDAELAALVTRAADGSSILPAASAPYFGLERRTVADADVVVAPGFAIIVIESGTVTIDPASGAPVELSRGATAAVPHAAGRLTLSGSGVVLLARPPRAS